MEQKTLFSVRMHASRGGKHVSGAEYIVSELEIESTVEKLIERALSRGCPREQITVTTESIDAAKLRYLTALDVITLNAPDCDTARSTASLVLKRAGISRHSVQTAIDIISKGAAPSGWNMRGAMIMDSQNGERLEPDHERGVRASIFDWSEKAGVKIDRQLAALGLTHYRTREALALATKVANAPGILAELCWSDEPDYTAGYVASRCTGYVRFPFFKKRGDTKGGRVFFVARQNLNMEALIRYLHKEAVLIVDTGACIQHNDPANYLSLSKSS